MKIGILGLGFMGTAHMAAYSKIPGVEVAAVCSGSERALSGDLSRVGGNIEIDKSACDFSRVRRFSDWREFVRAEEVDAVDVCLPTDLHAQTTIAALEAGKHVLCEKPMALTVEDCDRMLSASRAANGILMIGHVLRFWPEYLYLRRFVQSADYGKIRSATFVRRAGLPDWSRWLTDDARSGGAIVDLLLHDIDQALLLFGTPERVAAKSMGVGDTCMATLIYPGGPEVRIQGGWFQPGTPLSMSFEARAERGELEWSAGALLLTDLAGVQSQVMPEGGDGYAAELRYFVDCCRSGAEPLECEPEDSARTVQVALLIKKSRDAGGEQLKCSV